MSMDIEKVPISISSTLHIKKRRFYEDKSVKMCLCDHNCVILRTEQGMHHITKFFIYSTRKEFLEHAVVELVYKFDEKSTVSV